MLPAYNEEEYIRAAVEDFLAAGVVDEVLVVDNNSRDGTVVEARTTPARVVSETRQGYGYALRRGLQDASGDIIIMAEPDGTFLGRDVLKLLAYAEDFDMVCGTRTTRELVWDQANMGWFLRIGNWTVAKLIQFLYGGPSLSDCGCTMRLVHRAALEQIRRRSDRRRLALPARDGDSRAQKRLKIIEVPVNYRGRVGESKITGSLKGTLTDRFQDDRPHPQVPIRMTLRRDTGAGPARWAAAALVVCLAAVLPYAPTLNNYFVRDDFGVVELLSTKPAGTFRSGSTSPGRIGSGETSPTKCGRSWRCPTRSRHLAARRRRSCTTPSTSRCMPRSAWSCC